MRLHRAGYIVAQLNQSIKPYTTQPNTKNESKAIEEEVDKLKLQGERGRGKREGAREGKGRGKGEGARGRGQGARRNATEGN